MCDEVSRQPVKPTRRGRIYERRRPGAGGVRAIYAWLGANTGQFHAWPPEEDDGLAGKSFCQRATWARTDASTACGTFGARPVENPCSRSWSEKLDERDARAFSSMENSGEETISDLSKMSIAMSSTCWSKTNFSRAETRCSMSTMIISVLTPMLYFDLSCRRTPASKTGAEPSCSPQRRSTQNNDNARTNQSVQSVVNLSRPLPQHSSPPFLAQRRFQFVQRLTRIDRQPLHVRQGIATAATEDSTAAPATAWS